MALSQRTKDVMEIGLADKNAAAELAAAVDAGGNPQAAAVAAIPASTDLPTPAAIAASYADLAAARTSVNALRSDVVNIQNGAEARLDALESKINQVIAALKAAGLMAP